LHGGSSPDRPYTAASNPLAEADVLDSLFGRNRQPKQKASSGFWRIDLSSLGGPITSFARVALNLPQKSQKSQRPRGNEAAPPVAVEQRRHPQRDTLSSAGRREYRERDARDDQAYQQRYEQPQEQAYDDRSYEGRQHAHAQRDSYPQHRQQVQRPALTQPSTQDGLLAVQGVEKSFGKRQVVKGVSLNVRRGEAVGLLGPNGAGKTTVFYMITGLIKADRGRVDLDGFNISNLPMYQRARLGIGYLPQEASIFRGLTVEDNIRSVLEVVEPNRRRREQELDNLLEEFHITRLRKSPAIALSGGERRRVEIARALASRPNYMLLDEPFAGIDPIAVGDIQALVRHLTSRGIGVLITDHNVRETLGLTDRAYIIYSGQVLMEGRTEDIVNDPEVRRLYLGEEFRL
jgi:lipopolysaccharide export system ATP-binding protein